jgi:two-component system chemotaxis response regulator CheB
MPSSPRPAEGNRDVIVVGGSAGSVSALRQIARDLPGDLPAAVLVAIHRSPDGVGLLAEILDNAGPLRAVIAEEGQRLAHGTIYVAPPDRHLLVRQDHVHVRRGPRENRTRPAIDPLFRSAAVCCSTAVTGVLLSGLLNDGTSGLIAIRRCGGTTIVQDPIDAAYPDMPRNAIREAGVDHVLPVAELAAMLVRLAHSPRPPPRPAPDEIRIEAMIAAQELTVMPDEHGLGPLSPFTCPDCHGSIVEIREQGLIRHRCHTGHAFTLEALQLSQGKAWERTLYAAMRSQQEQTMLCRRLADHARELGNLGSLAELERRAHDYEEGAELIRAMLARGNGNARAAS